MLKNNFQLIHMFVQQSYDEMTVVRNVWVFID